MKTVLTILLTLAITPMAAKADPSPLCQEVPGAMQVAWSLMDQQTQRTNKVFDYTELCAKDAVILREGWADVWLDDLRYIVHLDPALKDKFDDGDAKRFEGLAERCVKMIGIILDPDRAEDRSFLYQSFEDDQCQNRVDDARRSIAYTKQRYRGQPLSTIYAEQQRLASVVVDHSAVIRSLPSFCSQMPLQDGKEAMNNHRSAVMARFNENFETGIRREASLAAREGRVSRTHLQQEQYNLCTGAVDRMYQLCHLLYEIEISLPKLNRSDPQVRRLLAQKPQMIQMASEEAKIYRQQSCDSLHGG